MSQLSLDQPLIPCNPFETEFEPPAKVMSQFGSGSNSTWSSKTSWPVSSGSTTSSRKPKRKKRRWAEMEDDEFISCDAANSLNSLTGRDLGASQSPFSTVTYDTKDESEEEDIDIDIDITHTNPRCNENIVHFSSSMGSMGSMDSQQFGSPPLKKQRLNSNAARPMDGFNKINQNNENNFFQEKKIIECNKSDNKENELGQIEESQRFGSVTRAASDGLLASSREDTMLRSKSESKVSSGSNNNNNSSGMDANGKNRQESENICGETKSLNEESKESKAKDCEDDEINELIKRFETATDLGKTILAAKLMRKHGITPRK